MKIEGQEYGNCHDGLKVVPDGCTLCCVCLLGKKGNFGVHDGHVYNFSLTGDS
jgi:hypothetical protein